jgi:hypothetical protein
VRWVFFVLAGLACLAASLALLWQGAPSDTSDRGQRHVLLADTLSGSQPPSNTPTPTPDVQSPPRPVLVRAAWKAASGKDAEHYSEGRFADVALRFGERLYIERVCVSDARKLTLISYRDAVGHTDVPLPLGDRGSGRVDPSERNCTLFESVEVTRVEKCKCRFQCAGELHQCTVSAVARRP